MKKKEKGRENLEIFPHDPLAGKKLLSTSVSKQLQSTKPREIAKLY